jgi:hypothetical protein
MSLKQKQTLQADEKPKPPVGQTFMSDLTLPIGCQEAPVPRCGAPFSACDEPELKHTRNRWLHLRTTSDLIPITTARFRIEIAKSLVRNDSG